MFRTQNKRINNTGICCVITNRLVLRLCYRKLYSHPHTRLFVSLDARTHTSAASFVWATLARAKSKRASLTMTTMATATTTSTSMLMVDVENTNRTTANKRTNGKSNAHSLSLFNTAKRTFLTEPRRQITFLRASIHNNNNKYYSYLCITMF